MRDEVGNELGWKEASAMLRYELTLWVLMFVALRCMKKTRKLVRYIE